ncbi:hypothetical protein Emed_003298 [Eimeria media]
MKLAGLTLLVTLSSSLFPAEAQDTIDAGGEGATQELLFGFNLARTARMDTQEQMLSAGPPLESQAIQSLKTHFPDQDNCENSAQSLTPATLGGFFYAADTYHGTQKEATAAVQITLNAGLAALGDKFAANTVFNTQTEPFDNPSAQNMAYLMNQGSTQVGCAKTSECTNKITYILCLFLPTLEDGVSIPFAAEVYQSMLARKAAGISLSVLNKSDMKTPLNKKPEEEGGKGNEAGNAASYGLPGFLLSRARRLGRSSKLTAAQPSSLSLPAEEATSVASTGEGAATVHLPTDAWWTIPRFCWAFETLSGTVSVEAATDELTASTVATRRAWCRGGQQKQEQQQQQHAT